MAVAVKQNREATSARTLGRLQFDIVAGVVYVLLGLALVFPLTDLVWWWLLGLPRESPAAWLGFLAVETALAAGLVVVGKRWLDARPIPGLRAGIALGAAGVLLLLLVTDWIGGQLADAFFAHDRWPRELGVGLTLAFGVAVLILGGRYFLSDKAVKGLVAVEEQGWFSSTSYKRSQGLRVRRGTILGVLVLVGCGIWVLHLNLMKQGGEAAWQVGIPFTGDVPVTWQSAGDDPVLREDLDRAQQPLTRAWEQRRQDALDVLRKAAPLAPEVRDRLRELTKDKAAPDVQKLLDEHRLDNAEGKEAGAEQRQAIDDALAVLREPEPGPVLFVSRFWLRDRNKWFKENYVKVTEPKGTDPFDNIDPKTGDNFKVGAVVPRAEPPSPDQVTDYHPGDLLVPFDTQQKLRQEKHDQLVETKNRRVDPELVVPPSSENVAAAQTEPVVYDVPPGPLSPNRVLLPHVAYTLPVLLLALGLWFAWRVVNVPAFADFLIATEAELNKVSWTTRRRLVQDTIVVLSTVFLMALFLLIADVVWSRVLTGIGVLQPPPKSTDVVQEQPW